MSDFAPDTILDKLRDEATKRGCSPEQLVEMLLQQQSQPITSFRAFVDNNRDRIARFDLKHRYLYINPAISQYIRLAAEDVIGKTMEDIHLPPSHIEYIKARLDEVYTTKAVTEGDYEYKLPDGTYKAVEYRCIPEFDAFGEMVSVIAIAHDISERKAFERALFESESRYRGILDSQIDLICQYTPDLLLTFVNDAYCKFFGQTAQELIGKSFVPMIDADQHAAIYQRRDECLIDPSPRVAEVRRTVSDGKVYWTQWVDFGIRDEMGKVILIQAVGRDVTRLKEVEAELREQEERYRSLFKMSPVPMWLYDVETLRFLEVNDAALRQYGYAREEMLLLTTEVIQAPDQQEQMRQVLAQFERESVEQLEWQHCRKNGTLFDVEITSHELVLNNRRVRFVVASDITERKLLEQQRIYANSLEVAIEKDREIMRVKEKFVSVVSHEFRTPLAVILSSVEILRRYHEKLTPDNLREKLEGIGVQVQRMVALLEDVLTVTKGNAGQVEFKPEAVDVAYFCTTLVDHIRTADRDRHRFVVEFDLPIGTHFMLDRRLLEHILLNLLSNASKYSPEGDVIMLIVEREDNDMVFMITDTGIGIPEKDQTRLFEPFHRADNVTAIDGTGLGLAIVKQSVDKHGGSITFESEEGRGTTFIVRLPAAALPIPHLSTLA